nr:MAG TPA: hypothetical protein [Caudoviricetes sp.]
MICYNKRVNCGTATAIVFLRLLTEGITALYIFCKEIKNEKFFERRVI